MIWETNQCTVSEAQVTIKAFGHLITTSPCFYVIWPSLSPILLIISTSIAVFLPCPISVAKFLIDLLYHPSYHFL